VENALILAGAVAKGAFEAGALEVLAARGIGVRRIVSASAGSLNGAVFAAGLRIGRALDAARSLVELWTDHASWNDVFAPSAMALFGLRGLSRTDRVRAILEEQLARWLDDPAAPPTAARVPIELRLVVTLANGTVEALGPGHATTFERVLPFDGSALDDRDARQPLVAAAIASAAFPLVFVPVDLGPGLGPAFDGGAVDNAPIHEAVHGTQVDRVFVVSTGPAEVPPLPSFSGEALVNRLAEILIGERLFRDMADAFQTNASLRALDALVTDGTLTPAQLGRVRQSLGWSGLRPLEIVPIRPSRPLEGGPFSGFFSADTRRGYIEEGRRAAVVALDG
jgi:NTE family protein